MLDEYIEEQPLAYKIILNELKNKKLSHAYILETNGYSLGFDFALALVKSLLCPKNHTNLDDCGNCTQCSRVGNNNYTELEIIEPDGLWIKKEQLINLQRSFSSKSTEGNKKVYIINHADKLNESTSNSILKFLEEPEEGIIAILLVDSCCNLLNTIVSRCQVIKLNNNVIISSDTISNVCYCLFNGADQMEKFKCDEESDSIINLVINFSKSYEENGINMILYENRYELIMKEKEKLKLFLDILVLFYKEVLNYKMFKKTDIFVNEKSNISLIADKNDINNLCAKINQIIKIGDEVKYNCNLNLLFDKLIMTLEGE